MVAGTVRWLLAALALALALPPVATAALPTVTLGRGYAPSVAVEKDGTAHFAWFRDGGATDSVRYCRVAARATACSTRRSFTGTGDASYRNWRPLVFVRGDEVTLLASFVRPQAAPVVNDHLIVRSTDGGSSFGTPFAIGDPQVTGPVDGVDDGSDSFGLVPDGGPFTVANIGAGPTSDRTVDLEQLVARPEVVGPPTIALDKEKSPLVAADYLGDTIVWRTSGGALSRAFVATKWSTGPRLSDEVLPVLSAGSGKLSLMTLQTPGGRCPCRYVFRRWDGTAFDPPFHTIRDFTGTGSSTGGNNDLYADAQGRIHAVWTRSLGRGTAQDPAEIRYLRSGIGGKDFREPITLTTRGRNTNPIDLEVASSGSGRGFVAWEEGGTRPDGSASRVRAVVTQPPAP